MVDPPKHMVAADGWKPSARDWRSNQGVRTPFLQYLRQTAPVQVEPARHLVSSRFDSLIRRRSSRRSSSANHASRSSSVPALASEALTRLPSARGSTPFRSGARRPAHAGRNG
jgi:hypothetical protein